MGVRQTHTYALLELSKTAYDEIAAKLRAAGYDHAFIDGAIDMHGLAVVVDPNYTAGVDAVRKSATP